MVALVCRNNKSTRYAAPLQSLKHQFQLYLDSLLANLENRDVALWVHSLPDFSHELEELVAFLGLPWQLVFSEVNDHRVVKGLEAAANISDPMTRKRGFIEIIDTDLSRIELPQRCLPIYLLNGMQATPAASEFESRLRRMTMLEELRRSGVRELLVLSSEGDPVPLDLTDLWSSGFRSYLTFVSDAPEADSQLVDWLTDADGIAAANLLRISSLQLVKNILARFAATYPEDRRVIRVRDVSGNVHKVDVTDVDDPERPILEQYSFVEERDLVPLVPDEILEEDFVRFFQNPEGSWRPFAAGLPWIRDTTTKKLLTRFFRLLDVTGSEENCVAYIASESGAGGTTLARALAWEFAKDGYPVLVAKPLPFAPNALTIANFSSRIRLEVEKQIAGGQSSFKESSDLASPKDDREPTSRRYEAPWLLVFDTVHWQSRDGELVRFLNELRKSGRPVCVLVVASTVLGLSFYNTSIFKKVAELNHALEQNEARQLGHHLNRFLRVYGKERRDAQWDRFYQEHTIQYLDGISAFWVTLAFWIQGQYDLSESIQQWMFRKFKENAEDETIQEAILEIAAMSSERLPLPEGLLPAPKGEWPVAHILEDNRASLSALGLVRVSANGERYWALVHDILGRFLINALFYDFSMREALGFASAKDAEHLRFLLLRQVSQKRALGERSYQSIAENFATSIFKIDPDHGHGSFTPIWHEVLEALDAMPRLLRDTSRIFRHHTAISRRRIAKLDENLYEVTKNDKQVLLSDAIEDIKYALEFIDYTPGSDSNLNLYNSLANAYLDLADLEAVIGTSRERIIELRRLANEATRKAYAEDPSNSFVIETYVKNLLDNTSDDVVEHCIEALGILFATLVENEGSYRKSQLWILANRALEILFKQVPTNIKTIEPATALDVLIHAWMLLVDDSDHDSVMDLSGVPAESQLLALDALAHPAGQGNVQVIRLRYDLTCIVHPSEFGLQLELVEQLDATNSKMTSQLQLEYVILLFLKSRAVEGDKVFRALRRLWQKTDQFIHIPERLRWLRDVDMRTPEQ